MPVIQKEPGKKSDDKRRQGRIRGNRAVPCFPSQVKTACCPDGMAGFYAK